jgi:hypothetical protein
VSLCTGIYTILRYLIFGGVSPVHIPVYLLNKSVAMAAVVSLLVAAIHSAKGNTGIAGAWRTAAWHCVCIHILLSVLILSDAYYPKFFEAERMNLTGESSMAFGVFAAYIIWCLRRNRVSLLGRTRLHVIVILLIGGHLAVMGFRGWMEPWEWHGGMPPISLGSFIFVVLCLILVLRTGTSQSDPAVR